jgi:hypothetical protein
MWEPPLRERFDALRHLSPNGNAVPLQVAARPFEGCRAFQRPEPGFPSFPVAERRSKSNPAACPTKGTPRCEFARATRVSGSEAHRCRACFMSSVLMLRRSGCWVGWMLSGREEVRRSATRIQNARKPWAEAPRLPSWCRSATAEKRPSFRPRSTRGGRTGARWRKGAQQGAKRRGYGPRGRSVTVEKRRSFRPNQTRWAGIRAICGGLPSRHPLPQKWRSWAEEGRRCDRGKPT